jgi:hypothetical protein
MLSMRTWTHAAAPGETAGEVYPAEEYPASHCPCRKCHNENRWAHFVWRAKPSDEVTNQPNKHTIKERGWLQVIVSKHTHAENMEPAKTNQVTSMLGVVTSMLVLSPSKPCWDYKGVFMQKMVDLNYRP